MFKKNVSWQCLHIKTFWVISTLFIVQSFLKWFVHFWRSFCKNSIRILCQIIFVNKHWPQSWTSPFNVPVHHSRQYFNVICDDNAHINTDVQLFFWTWDQLSWREQRWCSGLALGLHTKRSGVRFLVWPLQFQTSVISCFQVAIWMKYR